MEELELVQRCRAGDYAAFEALYEMHARKAMRTAYLIIHSKTGAEDAVQEAFVQVWLRIGSLSEPAAFRAWFYRILCHISHRVSSRAKRVVLLSLDLETHDKPDPQALNPDERVEVNEEIEHLRRAIASLPESQRLAVVLRYYACLQEAEVAQVLGIPVGTVKSRLHNAKQVLHRTLSTSSSTDLRAGL